MLQRAALKRKVATASCNHSDDGSTEAQKSGTTESHVGTSPLQSRDLEIPDSTAHPQHCCRPAIVESMAEASRRTLVLSEHICKLQRRIHAKLIKSGQSLTDMWQKATSAPSSFAGQSHNDSVEQPPPAGPSSNDAPSAPDNDSHEAYLKQKASSDFQAELLSIKRGVSNILKAERRLLSQHLVSFGVPVAKMNKLLNRNLTDEMVPSILEQASETFASVDADLRLDRLEIPVQNQAPTPQSRRSTSTQTDIVETSSAEATRPKKSSTSQTTPTWTEERTAGFDSKVDCVVEPKATLQPMSAALIVKADDSSDDDNDEDDEDDDLTPLVQRASTTTTTDDNAIDKATTMKHTNHDDDGQPAPTGIIAKDLQFNEFDTSSSPAEMTAQLQTLRWEESVFAKVRERRIERLAVESCAKRRAVLEQDVRNTDAELARIAVAKHQLQMRFRHKFDARVISKEKTSGSPESGASKQSPLKRKADQTILTSPGPVAVAQTALTQAHNPSGMIIRSEFTSGGSSQHDADTLTGVVAKHDGSVTSSVEKSKGKSKTPLEKLLAKIQESSQAKQLKKQENQITSHNERRTAGRSIWAPRDMLPFAQGGRQKLNALAVVDDDDEAEDLLNLSDVSAIPLASPSPVMTRAATRQHQQEEVQNKNLAILGEEVDGSSNDVMSASSSSSSLEVHMAPKERPASCPHPTDGMPSNHPSALVARELFTFEKVSAQKRQFKASLGPRELPQAQDLQPKSKDNAGSFSSAGSTSSSSSRSRTSSLSDEAKASLLRRAFQIGKKIAAVAEKARAKDPQHGVDLHELLQAQAGLSDCDSSLETDEDTPDVNCQNAIESDNQPQEMENVNPTTVHKRSEPLRNFTTYIPPVRVVANPTLAESSVETPTKEKEFIMNQDLANSGSPSRATFSCGPMMVNDGYEADRSMLETTPSAASNSIRRIVKMKNSKRSRKKSTSKNNNDAVVDRLMRPTFASATRSMPTQRVGDDYAGRPSSSTSHTPVKRRSRGRKAEKSPLRTKKQRPKRRSASKGPIGTKTAKNSMRDDLLNNSSSNSTPNASSSMSCMSVEAVISSEDDVSNDDDVSDAREHFLARIAQRTRAKQQLVQSFRTSSPGPANHGSSRYEAKDDADNTSTGTTRTTFTNDNGVNQSWSSSAASETSPAGSRHNMRRYEAKFGTANNETKTADLYAGDSFKSDKPAELHSVSSSKDTSSSSASSDNDFSETKEAHDSFNSRLNSCGRTNSSSRAAWAGNESSHDDSETQDPSIESGLTEAMDASAGTETEFPAGFSGEDSSEPFDLLGRHRPRRLATVAGVRASPPVAKEESPESDANTSVEESCTRQAVRQKEMSTNSGFGGADVIYTDGPSTTTEEEAGDNDFANVSSESSQGDAPINVSTVSTGPRPMSKLPLPTTPPKVSSSNGGVALEISGALHGGSQSSFVSAPTRFQPKNADVNASNETAAEGAAATIDAIAQRRQEREAIWAHIRAAKSVSQQELAKPMPEEIAAKTSRANDSDALLAKEARLPSCTSSSPNKAAPVTTTRKVVDSVKSKLQRAHQRRLTLDKLRSIRTRLDSWKGRIPAATGVFTGAGAGRYGKVSPYVSRHCRNINKGHDAVKSSQALTAGTMPLDQQAVGWLDSAEQYLLELEKAETAKEEELALVQVSFPRAEGNAIGNKERANAASRVLARQNAEEARRLLDHIARLRHGTSANETERRASSVPSSCQQ